ncbi:MAG: apolipoprotein N-acyltransferase, partial [Planctomycetes bacterium]|nr:apolipoprotein N-acyltransferase [Planctomycetota bacterium]
MPIDLMTPVPPSPIAEPRRVAPPTSSRDRSEDEDAVAAIIAAARSSAPRPPARGTWLLSGLTALLLWAAFMPLDWAPLGWIALVPLVMLVRIPCPTRWMYRAIYLTGVAGWVVTLEWMRLGHPMMFLALLGLAIYGGFYLVAFVAISRLAVHRLRLPLLAVVPMVWVAGDYLKAYLLTGFSWYYLGHTQYAWIELIQISDVTGAYGVTFLLAMSAACLAGLMPESVFRRLKLRPSGETLGGGLPPVSRGRRIVAVAAFLAVFAAVLTYGYIRRGQADFTARPGPRVALVQGNFTPAVKHQPGASYRIFQEHYHLTGLAVREQPNVIIWPETMWRSPLLVASPNLTNDALMRVSPEFAEALPQSRSPAMLHELSQQTGAAMIVGLETFAADADRVRHYNSAVFVRPDVGLAGRYDKMHRVLFGEYVPLRDALPFLQHLTPFAPASALDAGEAAAVFEYRGWRFLPNICFEDTVPQLVRRMVKS